MRTKNKIGALVVLGGIALLGAYWFKKNKPTTASIQAKALQKASDFYKTGGGKEETFIKGGGYQPPKTTEVFQYGDLDYSKLTSKEIEDIRNITPGINFSNLFK